MGWGRSSRALRTSSSRSSRLPKRQSVQRVALAYSGHSTRSHSLQAFAINMAVSYAISAVLGKKAKADTPSFQIESQDRHVVVRTGAAARRVIYGQMIASGPMVFASSTGSENKYLHMVVALANHEVQEIGSVYLNDTEILPSQLDGSGNVNAGTFSGKVRIKKHLARAAKPLTATSLAR